MAYAEANVANRRLSPDAANAMTIALSGGNAKKWRER